MEMKNVTDMMTVEEKAGIVQGTACMYTRPVKRLGVPALSMSDGPHGVRKLIDNKTDVDDCERATAFPPESTVANSWNVENTLKIGEAIGEECLYYGVGLILGPGVNIKRNPLCGRNFEYYSEDPYLAGMLAAGFINGLGKKGVGACIKHFAVNNQENFRFMGNSVVDEQALREIYLRAFRVAMENSSPAAVMTSYNRVNGVFASENVHLISDILRGEWNYDGLVMSDWGGTNDRIAGLIAGEDLEMPGDSAYNRKRVYEAIKSGGISKEVIDRAVTRIVKTALRYEKKDRESFCRKKHGDIARDVACDSAVLLKNDGVLPLTGNEKICVIGELFEKMRYQGSGSSTIRPFFTVNNKAAFESRGIDYVYEKGYRLNEIAADPVLIRRALDASEKCDATLVFIGLCDVLEGEGADRSSMRLPLGQLALMRELSRHGRKVVAVLYGGSPFELPFADDKNVRGILHMYLPGQCGGEAMARLVFGEADPSGKLAETWPVKYSDVPYGDRFAKNENELYKESVFVGYRYYGTYGVKVRYPFGYGLSYTEFKYSDMDISVSDEKCTVMLTVTNTGSRAGSEIVQIYVSPCENKGMLKPQRQLCAFGKYRIEKGEAKRVSLTFDLSSLDCWHVKKGRYVLENGEYTVFASASSCDDRLSGKFSVTSGEEPEAAYGDDVMKAYSNKTVSDGDFSKLLGAPLPGTRKKLPLTMESRLSDFSETVPGKLIYSAVCAYANAKRLRARMIKDEFERETRIKGANFFKNIFDTNCARTLAHSSGKRLPYNLLEGMVDIGNGKIASGVKRLFKPYKVGKDKNRS